MDADFYAFCLRLQYSPKPVKARIAAMIPAMVSGLDFVSVAGVVVGTAVASGAVSFAITNTAVVRPGTLKVLFVYEACFTTSSAEFC